MSNLEADRIKWEAECNWLGHVVPWPGRRGGQHKAEPLPPELGNRLRAALRCGHKGGRGALLRATGIHIRTLKAALTGKRVALETRLLLERWLQDHEAAKARAAE